MWRYCPNISQILSKILSIIEIQSSKQTHDLIKNNKLSSALTRAWLRPDLGNTTRAARAELGSIGFSNKSRNLLTLPPPPPTK